MSRELEDLTLSVLIRPYKGKFIGMCLEIGLIYEGETLEEVRSSLFYSIADIVLSVDKDSSLMPSLKLGLPTFYKFLFYRSVLAFLILKWWWDMKKIGSFIMQGSAAQFLNSNPAHVQ
jgi:hypothetical protein